LNLYVRTLGLVGLLIGLAVIRADARAQNPPPPQNGGSPAQNNPAGQEASSPQQNQSQPNPAPPSNAPQQNPPAPGNGAPAPPPVATSFEISGSVHSGKTPLPGVSVTASNTLTGKKYTAATLSDGNFAFTGLPRGRYVVRAEFMGFASLTQEIVLNPENAKGKADFEMILASRQQENTERNEAAVAATRRGFQNLSMSPTESALSNGGEGGAGAGGGQNPSANDLASLPLGGAGADSATESVSVTGAQGRTQDFGQGGEAELQDRIQDFRNNAMQNGFGFGGPNGPGNGGGFGGGPGGPGGGPVSMRFGRGGLNLNQPHGNLYYYDDTSALDARPFSLNGEPLPKADYNTIHFGGYVGAPLNIPKIYNGGNKTFIFGGWNATRGSTPYDALSTVPTAAERGGNFSALASPIFDPATGQQFDYGGQLNAINPAMITPQAQALLSYIPMPNLPGLSQNYHFVTSAQSDTDNVSLRIIHNFGPVPAQGQRGPFGGGGGGRGGGGGGGRNRAQNNFNLALNWTRNNSEIVNPFPSLAGGTGTQGLNVTAAWVYGKGHATNNLRVTYNHSHVSTTNLYSTVTNVPALAGIGGVSSDPFDWGIPGINFTSFSGLSDPTPSRSLIQTYTLSDSVVWSRGKHNWRFGGDFRPLLQSFRSARNGEGTFTFTGFATAEYLNGVQVPGTGSDLADFLLGLPQQTTLQSGTSAYNFRANSYDAFVQDDWRIRANLSLLLGVRYEYYGPYTEANNDIANLDVAPGFTAAALVLPGQTGPYNGVFPDSLIRPDRNDWAPRIGIAWKPFNKTVVRTGYGINYNLAQYGAIIQNFSFQPPFAETATNVSDLTSSPLTLADGFPPITPGTVTNNFAVNPNYKLAYVQLWNLDIQRELPGNWLLNVDYNGSKGTRLDTERALEIPGQQPFIYESSEGNSEFEAGSVRIRKRLAHGIGLNATYVYSKSIDDASSIGGGGVVVVQNPFDLPAERGLSSFDQRHKFTGAWTYDFPFGDNRRFLQKGALSHIFGGWQYYGDFTVASGTPFTIRVLGSTLDIDRGVSGSLRANLVPGQSLYIGDPTTAKWFNTAAFCVPETTATPSAACVNPANSSFGDAGRNILEGPGTAVVDMSLNKTIPIKEYRSLDLRISATNALNMAYFTSLGTTVNSITFGEVTGAGAMRRVTFTARFRF
jgi:trimeric autotransporter adhesin